MEFGDASKVEEQAAQVPVVPTMATTPFMPAIPTPVPIWTPEMANQFHSHSNGIPAGFDLSAYPEISNWPNHRSEPSPFAHHNAANRVQISFDSFPSSSNGIPQLLTQPDLPLPYSAVTNEGQFIPPYNSQFIPTYTSFNHHQLLGVEQPLLNTIHNQYAQLPGSSYFDYCSKTFAQIAPHQDDVIAAETRKDAATPITIEERNREGEDTNISTMCYNPQGKINGPTTKAAAVPAAQKDKSRDFDLNNTPLPKQPKRRKHRPKVVKEGQPKRTIKKAAAKTVQSKGNQAEKRKARKGLNTTPPQTEVTGEWTSGPKSTVKTCQRSLRFGSKEQAIDDHGRRENMLFANASSSRNRAADHNGLQECPNNSIGRDGLSTGCGLQAAGSKRKQPGIEQADNTSINLLGAQYNDMKAYCLNYGVQFPNLQKKRRSVKGRISEAPRKSSVTATKDVQLATFLQDARSHSYMSSPKCWASGSDYTAAGVPLLITATERAIQDKHQPLEYTLSLGQKRPTKRRSRASTRIDVRLAHSDRRTFGDAEGPQTCIDALVADLGASITKKKRTGKRSPVSYASSCKNERQDNTSACVDDREEIEIVDKNVDALADHFIFLNINKEAPERESHGQHMLVPYNQENGTIVAYKPKKKSIRPKVDIDEETNKVWALLLKDINNSGIDGSDAEKAIKWEQEREVYRGRAENFIAKMHQIQGDRGFSMWKGSVVDSVVGVFLTQNVSDHLSSSAFMALAARFPLKSTSTCHKESTSSHTKSTDESDSKKFESVQRHNNEHSPVDSAMTKEGQESLCQGSVRKELHNVISSQLAGVTSQTSGDFPTHQNPEKIGPFSDSYSEIEDLPSTAQFNIYYNRTSFRELLEMASSTMLHDVNGQRSKATESFTGRIDPSIDLNHDNQIGNLEKPDVIPYTLETLAPKEYTLQVTPNSGALKVNGYDRLTTEVPSSDSLKDKDENDKKYNFPTESDSKTAVVNSQEQTQEPKQKEREKHVGNPNDEKRKGEGKKKSASVKPKSKKENNFDWDSLRVQAQAQAGKREKTEKTMDSVDWDAVRRADVNEISETIKERGMNNMLAERIQNFLNLLVDKHNGIDLEWLRDVPPDQAKEFLLSIKGLGLKSVECIRLLTLHHLAFPVDTNVGRIAVRLGWVPIQPLPESLQLHLLELYPVLDAVQKYLWPRLCKLDQRTLYELHYQLITFGKVFCTKSKPNCNACPMRGECRHFASAFASARLALPGPEERMANTSGNNALPGPEERMANTSGNNATEQKPSQVINQTTLLLQENPIEGALQQIKSNHPIIEMPPSPDPERSQFSQGDIEDAFKKDSSEIPDIQVDMAKFALSIRKYVQQNMELQEGEMSKALVALNPDVALIPTPKLKNVSKLRTEHYVYELPDSHPLLKGWQAREPDDPGRYLLAIWTPGETADSIQPPERMCSSQDSGQLCKENECCACNSFREANSQIVRGTILIPCRTAMRGNFPLNGTYFQVNEVFADNDSSINPISVPRSWIWNLERRTVYFGTSVSSIFKGLSTQDIQQCFWRGYVCVRGFDRETRAPRPLLARLHFTASRTPKTPKAPKTPKTPKKKGNNEKMSKPANDLNKIKNQPELFSSIQETTEASRQ